MMMRLSDFHNRIMSGYLLLPQVPPYFRTMDFTYGVIG